jgi:hypothetical protein
MFNENIFNNRYCTQQLWAIKEHYLVLKPANTEPKCTKVWPTPNPATGVPIALLVNMCWAPSVCTEMKRFPPSKPCKFCWGPENLGTGRTWRIPASSQVAISAQQVPGPKSEQTETRKNGKRESGPMVWKQAVLSNTGFPWPSSAIWIFISDVTNKHQQRNWPSHLPVSCYGRDVPLPSLNFSLLLQWLVFLPFLPLLLPSQYWSLNSGSCTC